MTHRGTIVHAALPVLLLSACGGGPDRSPPPGAAPAPPAPAAEHHLHIRSADMAGAIEDAQRAVDQTAFEGELEAVLAADAVAALDSAGIPRAAVLSTAYMYGLPDVAFDDERARAAAENDFVSGEVERHPDRLTGFCSVNPLAPYAVEEIERCSRLPGMVGLKLHFANSDVDLRSEDDLDDLRRVFARTGELGMSLVVHMRTRAPDYGARDARVFIGELLPLVAGSTVQIAHMAGWGGYDDATDDALGVFVRALEAGELEETPVLFDLAAVVAPVAEGDSALERRHGRLAERIRRLGTERVVYGTDWSAIGIGAYLDVLRRELPLSAAELADVLDNRADYLR